MKKVAIIFYLLIFIASNSFSQKNIPGKQEVDYVNTLIGTAATGFANGLDGGRTMPCVGLRFVMTNFVAQTGESKMSRMNYFYEDSSVNGFFASQQPTAVNQNEDQSFIIHRCVSKIVRIYWEDFKKKKSNVALEGNTFKKMQGDEELFEIVLMLLLENVIKYSNDISSISPKVKLQELKNLVQITVSSFGIIISEKERSKIFSRGFSLEFQKLVTGTGMELHNAKELLKVFKCEISYKAICSGKEGVGRNNFVITCNNVFTE